MLIAGFKTACPRSDIISKALAATLAKIPSYNGKGRQVGMTNAIIKRRAFLFIGGYEPINATSRYKRFILESKKFEKTWKATVGISPLVESENGTVASWNVDSKGSNWRTETVYRLLRWDDFVVQDLGSSNLKRVPKGFATLIDFIFSGTAWRYFRVSVRYGFFFLCPVLIFAISAMLAIFAMGLSDYFALHIGSSGELPIYVSMFFALTVFAVLLIASGRFLFFNYMLDDWIFAGEFARQKRRALDDRLDIFAREIVGCENTRSYDEIIISAHSLGGALIMDVLDRALKLDPQLGTRGTQFWLMATGSSLLKVALHPKASWLRAAVRRVAAAPGINWIEYQAVVDVISFYKVDPLPAMGLSKDRNPIVQNVRMREMLTKQSYRHLQGNFFGLHRQWIMGNELKYFYDYFQACCGPAPLSRRVGDHNLPDYFGEDGSYDTQGGRTR